MLVFTDGASEDALHTVGGILIRPGCDARFFACHVPSELVKAWEGSLKHLIGPVETYAALVARAVSRVLDMEHLSKKRLRGNLTKVRRGRVRTFQGMKGIEPRVSSCRCMLESLVFRSERKGLRLHRSGWTTVRRRPVF